MKRPIPTWLANRFYKDSFPNSAKSISNRHNMYNQQMRDLKELEDKGIAQVIRPSEKTKVSHTEKDPDKLEELYQLGRKDAEEFLKKGKVA